MSKTKKEESSEEEEEEDEKPAKVIKEKVVKKVKTKIVDSDSDAEEYGTSGKKGKNEESKKDKRLDGPPKKGIPTKGGL